MPVARAISDALLCGPLYSARAACALARVGAVRRRCSLGSLARPCAASRASPGGRALAPLAGAVGGCAGGGGAPAPRRRLKRAKNRYLVRDTVAYARLLSVRYPYLTMGGCELQARNLALQRSLEGFCRLRRQVMKMRCETALKSRANARTRKSNSSVPRSFSAVLLRAVVFPWPPGACRKRRHRWRLRGKPALYPRRAARILLRGICRCNLASVSLSAIA